MGPFTGLGIVLSFVFGCILMGLIAEVCYLLWWKKRRMAASTSNNPKKFQDFAFLFCWRKPSSCNNVSSDQELTNSVSNQLEQVDLEMGSSKDLGLKGDNGEEGVDLELMRLHNLCGPPRFLFTIKEESKEDLESEDGKSRKGSRKSLSDLVFPVDGTPFLTPLSSPTVKASLLSDSYNNHGFNPLFEEAEINRVRSSPPPKFKFLKDAEDKLIRKLMAEAERKRGVKNQDSVQESAIKETQNSRIEFQEGKGGSFVKFLNQTAQVLPLASSPTSKPVLDKYSSLQ